MRAAIVLALLVSFASVSHAALVDPADAWRPVRPFIGSWKGTRAGAEGPVRVTRAFSSAPTSQSLEITEKGGDAPRSGEWGTVSLDPQRQVLVLRHFAPGGSSSDLSLVPDASSDDRLVFAGGDADGTRTRITYERTGPRTFVERIERATGDQPFAVVSETRFERKD